MAFPTIATFDYREPDVYVVKFGTSLAAATALATGLGQVKSISGRTTGTQNKKTFRRLSSATATTAYGSIEYSSTFEIQLYAEDDNTDLLALLQDATPSELTTNPTAPLTILVEVYNSISSGTLKHYWYLDSALPIETGFDVDADGDAGMTPIRFESTSKWIIVTN